MSRGPRIFLWGHRSKIGAQRDFFPEPFMAKILFPLPRRGRGKKNGFSSDFDTFSSSFGRGKNSPFFLRKKGPEIGGNNGSLRASILDLLYSNRPPRESHEWIRGGVPSEN